uniref:Retrotransposon protein, putative, unclassified n=1 Tax=Oryza sativa subsp. japonica TaxID=39947 RepID=Q2QSN0_ORYSJ|nr:retrotransposon protein, putative, unclassified [Oryza sativa Japonica Group]
MVEERQSFESQWAPSDVKEGNLKEMVAHGVLPAKEIIRWRPACGEMFPTPDTHEVVVFSYFFYSGFSLPTSSFFRGILDFYGFSLHHLNPNSIVHIANFIHACEAFLGVRLHFALFRHIFFLKPQPNKNKPCVVGGAGFQLRGTLSQKYFSMPFKTSNKVYRDTWNSLPMGEEVAQALDLLDRMLKLKEQGLQGEQITRHFIKSRLAPIKERSRTAFEFDGKHDPNREDPESLEFKIMQERMYKIFSNAIVLKEQGLQGEQITRHFIKSRLAPIKERSRTAFEFDGKHDPNREDPESLEFKIMQERMYKIFSNAIVVSYSHLLPVVPYNAFNPPPQTGNKGVTGKQPKQTNMKKKTSSRPMPKIRKSSRKPSNIDPSGKDPTSTSTETGPSVETRPTTEDRPGNNQPATGNVDTSNEPPTGNQLAKAEASADQEPPTRNQSGTEQNRDIPEVEAQANSPPKTDYGPTIGDEEEVLRIRSAEDSRPPILVKWWDDEMRPQGIVINKQKEDEEVCQLKKTLGQATRLVNRIHLRNEAKTATLEKLVPHLGTLEATTDQLREAKELARKTEHDLRDRIAELQDSNFDLSGSSKVQTTKISDQEKRIKALEKDKGELTKQRDSALKDVEDHKIKSQAQFDVLVSKIKRLEGARDEVANAATPLVQSKFFNNNSPSSFDTAKIFDKLRIAPDTYFKNIKEAGSMRAGLALAMTKSLYPKIDIDAIDGFADGTSEETALDLINDAQKATDKIAADVVERFQDNDLWPTGSSNSDDEKTDTN